MTTKKKGTEGRQLSLYDESEELRFKPYLCHSVDILSGSFASSILSLGSLQELVPHRERLTFAWAPSIFPGFVSQHTLGRRGSHPERQSEEAQDETCGARCGKM